MTGTSTSDAELWRRAAGGDHAAFTALFERHAGAVWNHAYRLTGSWTLAEDVAANTFLAAWRKRREVTLVRDSALPWLYAVAGNLVRNEHRRSGRFLRALRRLPAEGSCADHADAVASRVDDDRRMRSVLAAAGALPRAEREAFELCLLGEVSIADAAAVLGVAETNVRARLSRARARLRTHLEEES
ncbi:MAG TPA: RNA polymerase sigma factor [Actinophytocola sp.]|uniref:RNA polymerase sigma factor n=1 Tax=Actinophytocola sp. TaxID=1872138 RepID=UPI002DDD9DF1|nr:RNA polymerase sigma factor [Actinophytocola sp.]HEV2782447.1 RNA polymerase sigma factor [Actinophytocola sp.]